MKRSNTAQQLLDTAQALVQSRGYNAFSYRDLAEAVGVRTASIHYHFPTKNDLGQAMMTRYQSRLEITLAKIEAAYDTARLKLNAFVQIYRDTFASGDKICLCGSLASDLATLSVELRQAVRDYLTTSEQWLKQTLADGVVQGEFGLRIEAHDMAVAWVAALQGALVQGRAEGQARPIDAVEQTFLALLT